MLTLRKITETEFKEYLDFAVTNYANEKQKGEDLSAEEARKVSESSFQKLLPEGIHSPDQYLFSVIETSSGQNIGTLWLARRRQGNLEAAYIYDIFLDEKYRGKGYGEETMKLAEEEARKLGLSSIALHVFGHNTVAQKLYEKLGYYTTNRNMRKDL